MDYTPRYAQPFTFEQAKLLDVPIIFEEIARLQNSLEHLKRTQDELQSLVDSSEGDPDILEALEENRIVIGSQEERITMLKMALAHKGIDTGPGSHYELTEGDISRVESGPAPRSAPVIEPHTVGNDDDNGVFL